MIIKIQGGLGNQMFQYAYGRKLELSQKKVVFDISFFSGLKSKKDTSRAFMLHNFNIKTNASFIEKYSSFNDFISKVKRKIGLKSADIFYQNEKYFLDIADTIKKEFTLKNSLSSQALEFSEKIMNSENSVSIHIRRGDYISNPTTNKHHGVCDLNYYEKAIDYLKNKIQSPTFFVFSDDIEWVKENLKIEHATLVSNPSLTECEELVLMSKCAHNIIANSTFSWWSAWLNVNSDKIVIAPTQWTRTQTSAELNILPKSWIQI
jgi:hypothetical protein